MDMLKECGVEWRGGGGRFTLTDSALYYTVLLGLLVGVAGSTCGCGCW